jgi:hypothetical protein
MGLSLALMAAGVLLAFFGMLFVHVAKRRIEAAVESFGYGYFLLGLTLILTGAASGFGNQTMIESVMVIGYALVVLATVFMLRVAFYDNKGYSALALVAGVVGGTCLWIWSVMQYAPHPTLVNGALRFEMAGPVLTSLAVMLLGAWVPAGWRVAKVVATKVQALGWLVYAAYVAVPVAVLVMFSTSVSWPTVAVIAAAAVGAIVTVRRVKLPSKEA